MAEPLLSAGSARFFRRGFVWAFNTMASLSVSRCYITDANVKAPRMRYGACRYAAVTFAGLTRMGGR